MRNVINLSFYFLVLFGLFSCTHYVPIKNLDGISLNMEKEEVFRKLKGKGHPAGSILNKSGQVVEIWEYKVEKGNYWLDIDFEIGTCWLYFCNGKLIEWIQV